MNNKPVAWMSNESFEVSTLNIGRFDIPLYTHPAKTLTDEEIQEIWKEFDDKDADNWFIEIARAILRKANEK